MPTMAVLMVWNETCGSKIVEIRSKTGSLVEFAQDWPRLKKAQQVQSILLNTMFYHLNGILRKEFLSQG